MAATRLSDLTSGSAITATDLFYAVQTVGAGGVQITGAQLAEYARDEIGAALVGGTDISVSLDDAADTITIDYDGATAPSTTDDLPEGSTNLYYTDLRASSLMPRTTNGLTPHENLTVERPTVSTVTVQADRLILFNASGEAQAVTSVNVTANITASGLNGLDAGSEAADTWYYLYIIWNGTTVGSVLSTNGSAPALPAGYTHFGLVTVVRNNSSSDIREMYQVDDVTKIFTGGGLEALAAGTATSPTAIDISSLVPPNAKRVQVDCYSVQATGTSNLTRLDLRSLPGGNFYAVFVNRPASFGLTFAGAAQVQESVPLIVPQTMYYVVSGTNAQGWIYVLGWEF